MSNTDGEQIDPIQHVGQRIIAATEDLAKLICPDCYAAGCLTFSFYGKNLKIRCTGPRLDYGDKEAECGYTELVYSQFNRPELFVQFVELQHDDPAPKPLTIKQRLAMFLKLKN